MAAMIFYRVQSSFSYTIWDHQDGFVANGRYFMHYGHWLTRGKIQSHLNWRDRSIEPTPFISVFDNLGDAEARAELLRQQKHPGVFIARITVPNPIKDELNITYSDKDVKLPVLLHRDEGTTSFISTLAVRQHLGVDVSISQLAEWFVIEHIPRNMIELL